MMNTRDLSAETLARGLPADDLELEDRWILSELARAIERADEALSAFEQAVSLEPEQPGSHYGLASAAATLGRTEEALSSLRQAADLNPRFAELAASDEHFVSIKEDDGFRALVAAVNGDA